MTGYYLIHIETKTEEEQVEMRETLTDIITSAESYGDIDMSKTSSSHCFGTHEQNRRFISGVLDQAQRRVAISTRATLKEME